MQNPELYRKINAMQRKDAKCALERHASIFNWKNDGTESVLDFGTGPGDIIADYIVPLMPAKFNQLVGADISPAMVEYGQKEFGSDKIIFKLMDIAKDVKENYPDMMGNFDVLTSFFCLHFVNEQEKAMKNIFDYLKPGGRCLLVSLKSFTLFDGFFALSKLAKYEAYKEKIGRLVPYFNFVDDTEKALSKMLENIGFEDFQVEVREDAFLYDFESFKDLVRAVNPLTYLKDEKVAEEFVDDFMIFMAGENLISEDKEKVTAKYNLITVIAKKPYHTN